MRRVVYDIFIYALQPEDNASIEMIAKGLSMSKEIIKSKHAHFDLESVILDVIWLLDMNESIRRERFIALCKFLTAFMASNLMKERLEWDFLDSIDLVDQSVCNRKMIKMKTAAFFKQRRFNLLREQSEGFSILYSACTPNDTWLTEAADEKYCEIIRIQGTYELDPIRVVDIILDQFCLNLKYSFVWIALLSKINLGSAKLSFLCNRKQIEDKKAFCQMIAELIKEKLVQFESLDFSSTDNSFIDFEKIALLIHALLQIGCSEMGIDLLKMHPSVINAEIKASLSFLIEQWIEPFYSPFRPLTCSMSIDGECEFIAKLNSWLGYFKDGGMGSLLLVKLIRIASNSLANNRMLKEWLSIVVTFFIPSIIKMKNNPGVIAELWDLLKILPCESRYGIYWEWKTSIYSQEAFSMVKQQISVETKRVLRRIAKDNVKPCGRMLGKLTLLNPLVVFDNLMGQIQAYENIIPPLVDCLKYSSPLAFDCLVFVILENLSNPTRGRLKSDGTNISGWLQGLALFTGLLFKKYPNIELNGIIKYIFNQLNDGNSLDLIVLSELICKMSGFESIEDISDGQLEGQAGGDLLRSETLNLNQKNMRKSSSRLFSCLTESNLLIPLWILIAKQRNICILKPEFSHLKLLANLADQCHETFWQYSDFVHSNMDKAVTIPSVHVLMSHYGLDHELAFHIGRSEFEADCSFYQMFWKLTLADIYVPIEKYDAEIARQKAILLQAEEDAVKKKKEKEKLSKLEAEKKDRLELVQANINRLESEAVDDGEGCLFERCFLPRALFSAPDSLYSAKMLILKKNVALIEAALSDIRCIVYALTPAEAHHYGRFLEEISKHIHEAFVNARPLFNSIDIIGCHEKWQNNLFECFSACFLSKEYMQIRNSIIILTRINNYFPVRKSKGKALEKIVSAIVENESREDLKILAMRYVAMIKRKVFIENDVEEEEQGEIETEIMDEVKEEKEERKEERKEEKRGEAKENRKDEKKKDERTRDEKKDDKRDEKKDEKRDEKKDEKKDDKRDDKRDEKRDEKRDRLERDWDRDRDADYRSRDRYKPEDDRSYYDDRKRRYEDDKRNLRSAFDEREKRFRSSRTERPSDRPSERSDHRNDKNDRRDYDTRSSYRPNNKR